MVGPVAMSESGRTRGWVARRPDRRAQQASEAHSNHETLKLTNYMEARIIDGGYGKRPSQACILSHDTQKTTKGALRLTLRAPPFLPFLSRKPRPQKRPYLHHMMATASRHHRLTTKARTIS